jgi:hypothetical protein
VVVSLKPNLSFRLQEAADEFMILNMEEVTGDEPPPIDRYGRIKTVPGDTKKRHREEPYDEFQILRKAIEKAERDQNTAPVPWIVVRDEYFLREARMTTEDADRFIQSLSKAGFAELMRRTVPGKGTCLYVSLPRVR